MRDEFVKADSLTMHNNSNGIAIEISKLTKRFENIKLWTVLFNCEVWGDIWPAGAQWIRQNHKSILLAVCPDQKDHCIGLLL
jgi:hypothetical protein